jgi:hypothetical protein
VEAEQAAFSGIGAQAERNTAAVFFSDPGHLIPDS